MKKKHSKYYKTILSMYLVIVAAYAIVLVGVFSYYSYNSFSAMNEKNMRLAAEQIKESVDERLRIEESTTSQIIENEKFSDMMINNTYLNKMLFQRELNRICGYFVNQGSSITVLYGMESKEAVSPDKVSGKETFFSDMHFSPDDIEKVENFIKNGNAKDYLAVASNVNGENRLTILKKMRLYAYNNVIFCYSYSYDYILDNVYSQNSSVSVCRDGEILITNGSFSDEDNIKLAEIAAGGKQDIKPKDARFNGERYKIYTVSSDVNDWSYIFTVSDSERLGVIKRISLVAVFIFLLAIGIGGFVIKQFTEVVYKPIRKLVDSADVEKEEFDDEFAALKKAIETGKKHYNEATTDENETVARKGLIKDILNSSFSLREINERIKKHSLLWLDEECFVIVFVITNATELQKMLGEIDFYKVRDELSELLSDKINETMECETVRLSQERFAAVVRGEKSESLEKYIVEQINNIEYTTSVKIKVFISDVVSGADKIGKEYCRISENVVIGRLNSPVIVEHPNGFINSNAVYYPIELEKNLIENTIKGAKESVKLCIERLYEGNAGLNSKKDNTQLIFALTSTVNRVLQALDETCETVFGSDIKLYNELALCNDNADMKVITEAIFLHICSFVERQEEEIGKDLATEMLRFVDENFEKEISLYDIAERFNYSINYISRAFTRETGRNFKDYLNMVRVTKAKDLLSSGNYTIAQVAVMVGCLNANSFIRMFKRSEGITPGQYVENLKGRN